MTFTVVYVLQLPNLAPEIRNLTLSPRGIIRRKMFGPAKKMASDHHSLNPCVECLNASPNISSKLEQTSKQRQMDRV